jgi:putative two-component system response regulator
MAQDAIPLQGRMMAIVDVYDALVSNRPYKKAFPHEEAMEIIADGTGRQFDPVLADIFVGASWRIAPASEPLSPEALGFAVH